VSNLQDYIDAEVATAHGVGDVIELAQELAKAASHVDIADPTARKRLAQAMMLLDAVQILYIAKLLEAHDAVFGSGGRGEKRGEVRMSGFDASRVRLVATRLRHFQRKLDIEGADRQIVARIAGSLLDLAEELERTAEAMDVSPTVAGELAKFAARIDDSDKGSGS
jgi:hypothetical protein